MRSMLIAGAASLAGGGAFLSGAVGGGEYYSLPPAEVSSRLARMPLPEKLAVSADDEQLELYTLQATDQKVRWQLRLSGETLADVDAELTPTWIGGTRVSIDFRPSPEGARTEEIASVIPLDNDFVDDVIEMAIGEQADSYLENRPFDEQKLKLAIAAYAAAHPDKVKAFAKRMHDTSEALSESREWDGPQDEAWGDDDYGQAAPARGTSAAPEGDSGWDDGAY